MNASPKNALVSLFAITGLIIGGATAWVAQTPPAAPAQVVKLERVVIESKRPSASATATPQTEKLPRVVIEGRRSDTALQVAATRRCDAVQVC